MNKGSTLLLKIALVLIALGALAVCIFGIPSMISSDQTGYYKPVLIGMYAPIIPFFIALFQSYKLLTYIDDNKAFSNLSAQALKKIKYCGLVISVIYLALLPLIFRAADLDDAPGAILIGLMFSGASFVVATFAAVLQKLVEKAIEIKSENDLTV